MLAKKVACDASIVHAIISYGLCILSRSMLSIGGRPELSGCARRVQRTIFLQKTTRGCEYALHLLLTSQWYCRGGVPFRHIFFSSSMSLARVTPPPCSLRSLFFSCCLTSSIPMRKGMVSYAAQNKTRNQGVFISQAQRATGSELVVENSGSPPIAALFFFFFYFDPHIYTCQLLDKPWSQVSSLLPPRLLPSIFIAHRVQQSHCSSIFHRALLTHALALSASEFVHKKESQRICTSMHSAGLELTQQTYTRVEDNLIRHRGDHRCYDML